LEAHEDLRSDGGSDFIVRTFAIVSSISFIQDWKLASVVNQAASMSCSLALKASWRVAAVTAEVPATVDSAVRAVAAVL
jgi:hypothetical protein